MRKPKSNEKEEKEEKEENEEVVARGGEVYI